MSVCRLRTTSRLVGRLKTAAARREPPQRLSVRLAAGFIGLLLAVQLLQLFGLLALTLLGLLLAGAAGVFIARRVTAPLSELVKAAETMAGGDCSRALRQPARNDEIGELSRALERLRIGIAAREQAMRELACRDPLTGLPNRTRFGQAVQQAIDEASSAAADGAAPRPLAVVLLDLERFRHVNDVLGFAFGDRLLQGVAERLLRISEHEGEVVARLSGDAFALLLPGSDEAAALAVAERIADVFQLPMTLDDHTVDLSAAFGLACWPAHADDARTLIHRAEVALHGAQRQRGAPQLYDPRQDAGSAHSLSLLAELRLALDNGELRLYLQPRIALDDGRCTGAEALVRWQHPQRGLVPPLAFIPCAEQTGIVRRLTLWMIEATARLWASAAGPAGLAALGLARLSVNLSARDLLDAELPAKVGRILRRHGMPAQALCLEITERAIMDEPQRALATLNALSAAGFRLSIDDFGSGHSSLAILKKLPLSELKIDRCFVMAMQQDNGDARVVRSAIELAHNLGLTAVAEGVENPAVLRRLAELGCDEAQGFHMSRPLPADEWLAFARRWNAPSSEFLPA